MKLYFLVEGISSEMQAYPAWLQFFIPSLEHKKSFAEFEKSEKGYYFVSGEGYPSILNHLDNSAKDLVTLGDIDYFFVILDCDDETVQEREKIVREELGRHPLPNNIEVIIIIQNRCFETILLANTQAVPRQPNTQPLIEYFRYYNVITNDPELMGNNKISLTHSQFHAKYAIQALKEKRIRYSKSNCSGVSNTTYISNVVDRVNKTAHLRSFKRLADKLTYINTLLSTG